MNQLFSKASLLFVTLLSFFFPEAKAQVRKHGLELGGGLAAFVYQGDLAPGRFGSYRTLRPGLVLSVANILSPSFSVRLNAFFGSLRGDETLYDDPEYRKYRGFKFSTPVLEFSPQMVWNPVANNEAVRGFSPYLFAGAGISFFRIRRDHSSYDPDYFGDGSDIPQRIATDEQHRLPGARLVVPVGIGLRYNLTASLAMNAETSYRFLSTDYLDGFSVAANPGRNDHYQTTSAGVIYRLGNVRNSRNQLGCPVVKY